MEYLLFVHVTKRGLSPDPHPLFLSALDIECPLYIHSVDNNKVQESSPIENLQFEFDFKKA
jgi:hypothetical protein